MLTGISKHFLEAILKSEWKKLPAAPYLCGYFKKLEQAFDIETGFLWKKFQEESEIRTSGASDRLPENRFAIKAENRLRSEEHTSELQSQSNLVCRLLLEKKK